jgi:dTDP-4-amino-4,6-dideoxygalactose transaminase
MIFKINKEKGKNTMRIPFNKPYTTGKELDYIKEAITNGHLSGDGFFTKKCSIWLEEHLDCKKAFLTHSCTAALEMAAILADIKPGDEIIMPSFTFVSTANAFVLRGGVPVFVDIRSDTLNIDESKIESAITNKTKAIVPVHYAGVACEMDTIMDIAQRHNLLVIEDAAQGIMSRYKGKPIGSIGHMATLSFHETKNILSGEGGALLINTPGLIERAEIIREKGTNRTKFFLGEVDKYTWVDIGSSFLPSEIIAAFLWAQMEEAEFIINQRLKNWNKYHQELFKFEKGGVIRRPIISQDCSHNGHLYYLLLPNLKYRTEVIDYLKQKGIKAVFHYVPLDNSPGGIKFSRRHGSLDITYDVSERLVRLPLWPDMENIIDYIIEELIHMITSWEFGDVKLQVASTQDNN